MKGFFIGFTIGVRIGEALERMKPQKKRIFINKSIAAAYIRCGILISDVKKMAEKK